MSLKTAGRSDTEHSGVADRDVEKYLRDVRKLLHCPRAQRREFLRQLEANIYSYISENEVGNMEGVIKEFGSPEDIAQSFLDEIDTKLVRRSIRSSQRNACIALGILLVTSIFLVTICMIELIDHINFRDGYWVDTIGYGSPPPEPTNTFIAGIH